MPLTRARARTHTYSGLFVVVFVVALFCLCLSLSVYVFVAVESFGTQLLMIFGQISDVKFLDLIMLLSFLCLEIIFQGFRYSCVY